MVRKIALLFILMSFNVFAQNKQPETLKAMTFNIRMDTPKDGINQWSNRKEWVAEIVHFNEVDVVGMQEVTYGQLKDLEGLLPHYSYVGEGRESGNKGEFSPIFYIKDRFKLIDSGTFWLAENPEEKGMISWDSSLPRIATWARLEDKYTKRKFVFINTHFDHRGKIAREKSVEVIAEQLKNIVKGETVILTGDLNLPPTDIPYQKIVDLGFLDTREEATNKAELGYTFNSWDIEAKPTNRIDYIFSKGSDLAAWKYQELDIQRGARFASDHYPVMAEFRWVSKVEFAQKKKEEIRLLNYNVHHFAAANDSHHFIDVSSLAALISSQSVDIVTLQELDVHTRRSGVELDQIAVLAKRTGMYYQFGKTIDYDGGAYGIGILSKFPILSHDFYPLPYEVETEEKRGLLVCTLDLGNGKELTVATTHLASQSEGSRVLQAKEVIKISKGRKIDVLTGDFNAVESESPIGVLKEGFIFDTRFKKQLTIPTERSTKKIDFITSSVEGTVEMIRQSVYPLNSLSDHNIMLADFKL